jgi:hypothetical protein
MLFAVGCIALPLFANQLKNESAAAASSELQAPAATQTAEK